MKNLIFITLAIILLGANAVGLRKETETSKSTVHLVKAEIAEPIHYENQYHSGGDISPEIVYAPVQFRFKETEQLRSNEKALGKMRSDVHYSSVETVQVEPESEGGFFSPEIVSRFVQVEKVSKNTDERKHHKKHKQDEPEAKQDEPATVEAKQDEPTPVEAKQDESAPVEANEPASLEAKAKQDESPEASEARKKQDEPETAQAKQEEHDEDKSEELSAKIKRANKAVSGLDIVHPEGWDHDYEIVSKVAHISDYSQEDLVRIANGGARVFAPVHHDETYNTSPLIYHHVIQSATTDITTAKSPLTETKKVLWRDFVPPSNGFDNVIYKSQLGQTVPDVHKDEQGHPREYWANVLNYPTPVNVGEVVERQQIGVEDLTNVSNPIKTREFKSTYDHEVVPNPV